MLWEVRGYRKENKPCCLETIFGIRGTIILSHYFNVILQVILAISKSTVGVLRESNLINLGFKKVFYRNVISGESEIMTRFCLGGECGGINQCKGREMSTAVVHLCSHFFYLC